MEALWKMYVSTVHIIHSYTLKKGQRLDLVIYLMFVVRYSKSGLIAFPLNLDCVTNSSDVSKDTRIIIPYNIVILDSLQIQNTNGLAMMCLLNIFVNSCL